VLVLIHELLLSGCGSL